MKAMLNVDCGPLNYSSLFCSRHIRHAEERRCWWSELRLAQSRLYFPASSDGNQMARFGQKLVELFETSSNIKMAPRGDSGPQE